MNRCEMCKKNPLHPDKKCCFNCSRSSGNCDVWHNCGEDCPEWDNAVKTNADRIRAMSDEELAELLLECENVGYNDSTIAMAKNGERMDMLEWLKQPAEDVAHGSSDS